MKKLGLVALPGLVVALGFFLLRGNSHAPLIVRIIGMTNQEDGGVNIYFSVSNQSTQPYYFFSYPQEMSNAVWFTSIRDRGPFGGTKNLLPHTNSEQIVYTYRDAGITRLQVTYALVKTPRQRRLDDVLTRFHLEPFFDDWLRRELTTPPFELPGR